jgi:Cu+-exporting ATPase
VQKLADQVAAVFVPSVLGIALITVIGWYAWGSIHRWPAGQTSAAVAKAACSVLIIACPCALGLAVPTAIMVGTGLGARRGILLRNIDALQRAERIDTIVLDKTGTVTQGKPVVSRVIALNGVAEDEILRLAASAEQYSSHPLARAVLGRAKERRLPLAQPQSFNSEAGLGIVAEVEGSTLLVGSPELVQRYDPKASRRAFDSSAANEPATWVCVARHHPTDNGKVEELGLIAIADQVKPDSKAAVRTLHAMGLRTLLLTGDNQSAAERVAREVGIEAVRAGVKPDQKAAVISELQGVPARQTVESESAVQEHKTSPRRATVAMVGDGINDAPALAAADVGMAMATGTEIAMQAAGITLMRGDPALVGDAIEISRRTYRKIRQNLFWAFAYNVVGIPLAALGLLSPVVAGAAMALSSVSVVSNALMLRRWKGASA